MTIYIGPGANGSGISDLMVYLNGTNYAGMIGWNTLYIIDCLQWSICWNLCLIGCRSVVVSLEYYKLCCKIFKLLE